VNIREPGAKRPVGLNEGGVVRRVWLAIERVLAASAVAALFALVGLPFAQVVMRDAFESPVMGLEEATRWGLIALVYLGLPLLIPKNEQIRFDELVNRLPGRARCQGAPARRSSGSICWSRPSFSPFS
jgi:hypothetical protein